MRVFIDTNILLHYAPLDQIDFEELTNDKYNTLVFAPVIIFELDKHKRSTGKKQAQRAKSVVKKIEEISSHKKLTKNTEIDIITSNPNATLFNEYSLDREEQDDKLLASIIEYTLNNNDEKIALLTGDLGLKLKSKSLSIDTISIPEKYEIVEEEDSSAKEINRLKRQLEKYAHSIPKLSLTFKNSKEFITVNLKRFVFEEFKKEQMIELRSNNPYLPTLDNNDNIFAQLRRPIFQTEESIKKYNDELDSYYSEYENFLDDNKLYFIQKHLSIILELKLHNEGTIPATDIDINMHFPDGFTICSVNNRPTRPDEPKIPSKPGEFLTSTVAYFSTHQYSDGPTNFPFAGRGFSSIEKTNSYNVNFDVSSLKHNMTFDLEHLLLSFDDFNLASGFKIEYEILAANVPEIITGQLNVKLDKN